MLLSTLCTHTVHVFQVQQYNMLTDAPGQSSLRQQQQSVPDDVASASNNGTAVSTRRTSSSNIRRISSSSSSRNGRSLTDSVAYSQYMLALCQVTLSLACSGTFRPQQYSNVLWCFARCGYRPPTLWVDKYLTQVRR
jgi:hypothetical protein